MPDSKPTEKSGFSPPVVLISFNTLFCEIKERPTESRARPSRTNSTKKNKKSTKQTNMVGKMTVVNKPSRSDEVLDEDQQLKIANHIRAQFDSITPKRPLKPNRSESDSSTPTPVDSIVDPNIPELDKFHSLQSQSHVRNLFFFVLAFLGSNNFFFFFFLTSSLITLYFIRRLYFQGRELQRWKMNTWKPSTTGNWIPLTNSITLYVTKIYNFLFYSFLIFHKVWLN